MNMMMEDIYMECYIYFLLIKLVYYSLDAEHNLFGLYILDSK